MLARILRKCSTRLSMRQSSMKGAIEETSTSAWALPSTSFSIIAPSVLVGMRGRVNGWSGQVAISRNTPSARRGFAFTVDEKKYSEVVNEVMDILEETFDNDELPFDDVQCSVNFYVPLRPFNPKH